MAYIGTSPSNGVRRIHTYTATAGQTTFSGSSTEGVTLTYADTNYIDVFQNGVLLGSADYTSTSGTSVVLAQGASVSDLVVIVVYDVFSVADTVSKSAGGSFDGNLGVGGTLSVTGTSAFTGAITSNAGVVVDNITIDGTEIDLSSGDLTVDVAGDITLDAGGGDILFEKAGTTFLKFTESSGDAIINQNVSDKDIKFNGNDGGSGITALSLDMSEAGRASFNTHVDMAGILVYSFIGSGGIGVQMTPSGNHSYTAMNFRNSSGGQIGHIAVSTSATAYNTSSDYRLKENVSYNFDATSRLKQLKPARFNFIVDADNTVDGFLAHEVSSIVPEAITGAKDATEDMKNVVLNADGIILTDDVSEDKWTEGKADKTYAEDTTWVASKTVPSYQGIDQSKLVPLLVKTIQELEARITALESK